MGILMSAQETANSAIGAAIVDLNRQRAADQHLVQTADTALIGPGTNLDSLGLITLIVAVEQKVEELSGRTISLTDLTGDTGDESALRTIGTLTNYLISQLEGDYNG